MLPLRKITAFVLTGLTFVALPARATTSEHVVSTSDIQRALGQRTTADAQRATIVSLLQRAEVREMAARSGLDVRRAEAAAMTLDGDDLRHVAEYAASAESGLAGGSDTIHISLVVLLLIIIIVILLVK